METEVTEIWNSQPLLSSGVEIEFLFNIFALNT